MNKSYDVITFIQNIFNLRRPRVANFADIIKITTKNLLKTQKKLKELEIMC